MLFRIHLLVKAILQGYYGTLFSDKEVQELYPAFQNQYMLATVKKWILRGIWDVDALTYEIEVIQSRLYKTHTKG